MKWVGYIFVTLCVFVGLTEHKYTSAALITVALVAVPAIAEMKE
jgi:hypothetical protein